MAFHHYNRLLDHWEPKIKPEGLVLGYGSKQRYKSLTPGAVAVAQFVAGHLNSETNSYPISQKTIEAKLGLTKATISKALDELVAWGVLYRQRSNYEKPYEYFLAIKCPTDCDHLETHNTKSELATLPKKQATPLPKIQETPEPKEQATGGLQNRQLIESNKETNKEMNRTQTPCFNCSGIFEILENGQREIIHTHDCSQLNQMKQGQAWNITQTEYGSAWDSYDNREQQIANYLSLAKGRERKAKQIELITGAELEKKQRFERMITRTLAENELTEYEPTILEWLKILHAQDLTITDTHIRRAVDYTKLGWQLKPEGYWRDGYLISRQDFIQSDFVASEGSND